MKDYRSDFEKVLKVTDALKEPISTETPDTPKLKSRNIFAQYLHSHSR